MSGDETLADVERLVVTATDYPEPIVYDVVEAKQEGVVLVVTVTPRLARGREMNTEVMRRAFVWSIGRLESDDYSVPRGSHGIPEPCQHLADAFVMHWLPPQTGSSVPVWADDLADGGELMIPENLIAREGEGQSNTPPPRKTGRL